MQTRNKSSFPFRILCLALCSLFVACNSTTEKGETITQSVITPKNQVHGGVDGGGGNYVGSEAQQIKAIFHGDNGFDIKETVKQAFKNIEFQVKNKFVDAELESIFSRMLGPKFSGDPEDIYNDIEKSPYELKSEGSCLEQGSDFKDASAKIDKKGTPICFSLDGLKQLPIQAVPFQLVALAVHEHAHHYGFDEIDAVKAQKHVLNTMTQGILSKVFMDTIGAAGSVRDHATKLLGNLSDKFSDKLLCKHLSIIDSTASNLIDLAVKIDLDFEIRMLVTALDHSFGLTKESLNGVDDLKDLTSGMLMFCGEDSLTDRSNSNSVNEGDRNQLHTALSRVISLAHQIVLQASNLSKQRKNQH